MTTEPHAAGSRRPWILAGILVVLVIVAGVVTWRGLRSPAAGAAGTSNTQRRSQAAGAKDPAGGNLDVKLDSLRPGGETPPQIERNPFRFEARRRPDAEGEERTRPPARVEIEPPPMPSGPPPPPPIALKFIGIIESPEAGRVAALTDGRRVFHGRAGEIVDGRYKIVRIGVESIVIEYADGTGGPQTIRLSGQ